MKVIGHERPGKAIGFGGYQQFRQPLCEEGPVVVIEKNVATFYAANYDMMEKTGYINPR